MPATSDSSFLLPPVQLLRRSDWGIFFMQFLRSIPCIFIPLIQKAVCIRPHKHQVLLALYAKSNGLYLTWRHTTTGRIRTIRETIVLRIVASHSTRSARQDAHNLHIHCKIRSISERKSMTGTVLSDRAGAVSLRSFFMPVRNCLFGSAVPAARSLPVR